MKTKKHQPKEPSQRSLSHKGSGLTNRKPEKHNKQNLIQITEPLDFNQQTYPSKQFILSRESLNTNSKSALRDISDSRNIPQGRPPKSQPVVNYNYNYQPEKSNQLFDRRLSLKCTGNYSQQLDYQKSQRLSMAPLRRESLANMGTPSLMDQRQSLSSTYQNSVSYSDGKGRAGTVKKQAIMTNLMHKLDHEEDLRTIIQNKLRVGTNSSSISCQPFRKNTSYITDFSEEHNNHMLASKLEQCQNEISYFKSVIRDMSEKIVDLTEEKKFKKKGNTQHCESQFKQSQTKFDNKDLDVISILKKISSTSSNIVSCHCQQKQSRTVATQVDPVHFTQKNQKAKDTGKQGEYAGDFLDNLQRTLKVLDGKQ